MLGNAHITRCSALALFAALALPGSTQVAAQEDQRIFAAEFSTYLVLPPPPGVASGAVDLSTITPPREKPPEPDTRLVRSLGTGVASYYGRRFHGRRTANGERFNMNAMTAAHKTLPFGTKVRVTNPRNGKSVVVRINDRGPFIRGRTIDLSRAAASRIGMIATGHAHVKLEIVR